LFVRRTKDEILAVDPACRSFMVTAAARSPAISPC
jgi:hypothetical protein